MNLEKMANEIRAVKAQCLSDIRRHYKLSDNPYLFGMVQGLTQALRIIAKHREMEDSKATFKPEQ